MSESSVFDRILAGAVDVDRRFETIGRDELLGFRASFPVPASHPRSADLRAYSFVVGATRDVFDGLASPSLVLADAALRGLDWLAADLPADARVVWLAPSEGETKERGWLDRFYAVEVAGRGIGSIVAVGGGILINAASYLAEREGCALAYVPTTVLAMADAAIGGKVRANVVDADGACRKHAYKSWYEPDRVVADPRFLDAIPDAQVSAGMGEILKQGAYQSRPLLAWLASDGFDPFRDRAALLHAILWAVALAANALAVDPEETPAGAGRVMRGAHDASDRLEEASSFRIPHGIAVARAIRAEFAAASNSLLPLVDACLKNTRISLV